MTDEFNTDPEPANKPDDKNPHSQDVEARRGTLAVWAGEMESGYKNATQTPIVQSVSYAYNDLDEWAAVATGEKPGHIYGRNTNPTVEVLEEKIRVLESAEAATSFASGMAAISDTLFSLLSPGSRVVSQKDTYGGTSRLFLEFLPRYGVHIELCETTDYAQFEQAISKGCDVLYLETPTNPTLKILDLTRLSTLGHKAGAIVVVDNTFATPINQNPLSLGADLVVHSATKFLGGHSDALGGLLTGRADLVKRVFGYREINGATLGPMSAYLLIRGMKTLDLRMERQNQTAMTIAEFLEDHEGVREVHYPGLKSHPDYEIARKQMRGFGGVLSFTLTGDTSRLTRFLECLKWAHLAAHLGGVETIAGPPRTTSHVELTEDERAALGISENLIRYSVGIENAEDLISDLSRALDVTS